MNDIIKDKYILFSLASVLILVTVCTVTAGPVNGNGMTEIEGVISDPSPSQNGTTFKITDLSGKEFRCFYRSDIPSPSTFCKLIGSFSDDGNMFFVDTIKPSKA
jgi:hypothetical protein